MCLRDWSPRLVRPSLSIDLGFYTLNTLRITGEATSVEGTHLIMTANFIVCLGAPKMGLMNALTAGEGQAWQLFVADIGISNIAWRKYGTRRRHGVDFGNHWVVSLRYQAGVS